MPFYYVFGTFDDELSRRVEQGDQIGPILGSFLISDEAHILYNFFPQEKLLLILPKMCWATNWAIY
jgi:hypothetical protein